MYTLKKKKKGIPKQDKWTFLDFAILLSSSNGYTQYTTKSTVKKVKAWTIGFFLPCAFTNFLLDRQTL